MQQLFLFENRIIYAFMLEVYHSQFPDKENEVTEKLWSYLPTQLCQKISKKKRIQYRLGSLYAYNLLNHYIQNTNQWSNDLLAEIQYNHQGKPTLNGKFHFSISHTQNRAILVINSKDPVGADIEKYRELGQLERYQQFMPKKEWKLVANAENPNTTMLHLWAKKEALVKCIGESMFDVLDKMDVSTTDHASWQGEFYYFYPILLSTEIDFIAYACSSVPNQLLSIEEIKF